MDSVHLRPRLRAVLESIEDAACAADIGCDHGRLCAALLQSGRARRVIGSDISEASLQKARALRELCGLNERWELKVSDGLTHLFPGEADVLTLCGMGGELIAALLASGDKTARAARAIHMQPMRGSAPLRKYLYAQGYEIFDERIVLDAGRYYQLISARAGVPRPFPKGFPPDMYTFGALSLEKRDPLLLPMLRAYRAGHARRLTRAQAQGRQPAQLIKILADADTLLALAEKEQL